MPRSKRARVVHESKTAKKDHKEQTRRLYANIRECVEEYDHLFLFAVDNMRNTYLKDVRAEFADSRYVLYVKAVFFFDDSTVHGAVIRAIYANSSVFY